jgi:hypothetical protein
VLEAAGAAVLAAGGVASAGAAAGAAVEAAGGVAVDEVSSDLLQPDSMAAATKARAVIEITFMILGSSFVMYWASAAEHTAETTVLPRQSPHFQTKNVHPGRTRP